VTRLTPQHALERLPRLSRRLACVLLLFPPSHSFDGRSTMPLNLDAYLGVQQDALKVQSKRMEVLAKNLANVDTPN
jgi:hypothetical protein